MIAQSDQSSARTQWLIFAVPFCGYILVYCHRLFASVSAVDFMRDLKPEGCWASAYQSAFLVLFICAGIAFGAALFTREILSK